MSTATPPPESPTPPSEQGKPAAVARPGRARRMWAVAGLTVVAVAVALLVTTRGGSPGPEDAVEAYLIAARDGDCETMTDKVSATKWQSGVPSRGEALARCREGVAADDSWRSARLLDLRIVGSDPASMPGPTSTTAVEAVIELDGEELTPLFILADRDGWKIEFCSDLYSQPCA